jgi:hypothetical protein
MKRSRHHRDQKKVHLSFPGVPIWPGLSDVGPDTEFVGNPVTIRTTDGRSYSARVDIPRCDPALPLTDDELLSEYRDFARSQLSPDDLERSVGPRAGERGRYREGDGDSQVAVGEDLRFEALVIEHRKLPI